jgi:hypothetical protein
MSSKDKKEKEKNGRMMTNNNNNNKKSRKEMNERENEIIQEKENLKLARYVMSQLLRLSPAYSHLLSDDWERTSGNFVNGVHTRCNIIKVPVSRSIQRL